MTDIDDRIPDEGVAEWHEWRRQAGLDAPDGRPVALDGVRVFVYQACEHAASGSAMGPHGATSYWWTPASGEYGIRLISDAGYGDHDRIRRAISDAVAGSLADAARAAQDARAEAPDL